MPSTNMDSQSMETHFEALELGQRQLTEASNKLEQVLSEFISWLLPIKQEPADSAAENRLPLPLHPPWPNCKK
jgi:hypothetical protein